MTNIAGHGHLRKVILDHVEILESGNIGYADVSCMIDTKDMTRLNVTLIDSRQATDTPTGLTVTQGYAIYDPATPPAGLLVDANEDIITDYIAPAPGSAVPIETISGWNVSIDMLKRLIIYTIANEDATNPGELMLIIDFD